MFHEKQWELIQDFKLICGMLPFEKDNILDWKNSTFYSRWKDLHPRITYGVLYANSKENTTILFVGFW
jgi:hypothetical protein